MARASKSVAEKEQELLATIAEAKKKLEKLQQQQKIEIGALAIKHGLHQFSNTLLDHEFKKISQQLSHAN
ncbi:TPA: hypothetical protein QH041_003100 [Legionella pneumophila]|nr:hypothetical protein [Legionella pneumophila]HDS3863209.1 hypothetical protein [Legionella pneumophila]